VNKQTLCGIGRNQRPSGALDFARFEKI